MGLRARVRGSLTSGGARGVYASALRRSSGVQRPRPARPIITPPPPQLRGAAASIKAVITNDSKSDVRSMKVKLVRCIELCDDTGCNRTFTDVVAQCV